MGNWYTNICVKDRQQSHVIDALDELGRRAYVTPDTGGWIIRYDQEYEKFDLDLLQSPALTISTRLSCIALPAATLTMTFFGWGSTKMASGHSVFF